MSPKKRVVVAATKVEKRKKKTTSSSIKPTIARPPYLLQQTKTTKNGKTKHDNEFSETFDAVANLLTGRKNIIVLVGAGISVSCGIPDFRSKGSGIYSTLDIGELGLSCPEELFDWDFFQEDPSPFFKFARHLYFPLGQDKKVEPSDSHKLLAMLEQKKMLLRVYSQNIDGLEHVAGVSNRKMIYAHGSLHFATCCTCQRRVSSDDILPDITKGSVPRCQASVKPPSLKRRNSSDSSNSSVVSTPTREPSQRAKKRQRCRDDICGGVFKPAVTFFGETLNDNVRKSLEVDRNKVDALIVIGTSLSVAPISKVIEYLPTDIPRILINRTVVHPSFRSVVDDDDDEDEKEKEFRNNYVFDAYLLGFCDDVTRALAKKLFSVNTSHKKTGKSPNNGQKSKRRAGGRVRKILHDLDYGGKLLSTVLENADESDDEYNAESWSSISVPPKRVLLFPGALASRHDDESSDVTYREIAHCDGCSKQIRGTIHKCAICFDYDLCKKCFPSLSKTHHDGKHTFNAEKAS